MYYSIQSINILKFIAKGKERSGDNRKS